MKFYQHLRKENFIASEDYVYWEWERSFQSQDWDKYLKTYWKEITLYTEGDLQCNLALLSAENESYVEAINELRGRVVELNKQIKPNEDLRPETVSLGGAIQRLKKILNQLKRGRK